ncbi:MAG: DMT family transporter [Thermoplasmata archaeon]
MRVDSGGRQIATAFAVLSGLIWSSYYVFALWLAPLTSAVAVVVYPFLVGGAAFLLWAVVRGEAGVFLRLWKEPASYVRILLAVVMQASTLAATYSAGPVDTSLLALLGDVVMVPLMLMVIFGEDRPLLRSPWFLVGIFGCLLGDGITIVAGHTLSPVSGFVWLVVPAIPISTGLFFLLLAHAARRTSMVALIAQAFLGAGVVCAVLSPILPGGNAGLYTMPPPAVLLLIVMGITTFFVAPYLYFAAIERGGLVPTAIWMALIPAFTLLMSVVVLGLAPEILGALGVPIAIVGAFLALEGQRRVGTDDSANPTG